MSALEFTNIRRSRRGSPGRGAGRQRRRGWFHTNNEVGSFTVALAIKCHVESTEVDTRSGVACRPYTEWEGYPGLASELAFEDDWLRYEASGRMDFDTVRLLPTPETAHVERNLSSFASPQRYAIRFSPHPERVELIAVIFF